MHEQELIRVVEGLRVPSLEAGNVDCSNDQRGSGVDDDLGYVLK